MLDELKLVLGKDNIVDDFRNDWKGLEKKIITQARREKGVKVISMVSYLLENDEGIDNMYMYVCTCMYVCVCVCILCTYTCIMQGHI